MEAKQWLEEVAENQNADMALLMQVDWGMIKEQPYRLLFVEGTGLAVELEESLQDPIIIPREYSHAGDVAMRGVPAMICKESATMTGLDRRGVEEQGNAYLVVLPVFDRGRVVGIVTLGFRGYDSFSTLRDFVLDALGYVQGAVDYL